MISMIQHKDGAVAAAEILMLRSSHKGPFVLVEGVDDYRRFTRLLDRDSVMVVVCNGKPNAIQAADICASQKFQVQLVCMLDKDFDGIFRIMRRNSVFIYSENYDFDMDILDKEMLAELILETCSDLSVNVECFVQQMYQDIAYNLRAFGCMKYIEQKFAINLDMNVYEFMNRCINNDPRVIFNKQIDNIIDNSSSRRRITNIKRRFSHVLCNGGNRFDFQKTVSAHDFFKVVSMYIARDQSFRRRFRVGGDKLEQMSRLASTEVRLARLAFTRRLVTAERRCGPLLSPAVRAILV
jgi:hypothetical protein